jgi:hypothetical protein
LFSFDYKSHPNCKIKIHAVRFGSVDQDKIHAVWFGWFLKCHPNQTNAVRIGSVVAVYSLTFQYQTILNIKKKLEFPK